MKIACFLLPSSLTDSEGLSSQIRDFEEYAKRDDHVFHWMSAGDCFLKELWDDYKSDIIVLYRPLSRAPLKEIGRLMNYWTSDLDYLLTSRYHTLSIMRRGSGKTSNLLQAIRRYGSLLSRGNVFKDMRPPFIVMGRSAWEWVQPHLSSTSNPDEQIAIITKTLLCSDLKGQVREVMWVNS